MNGKNEQLKAAIYGLAVADALGVPVEFKRRGSYKVAEMTGYGTYNQPPGTWSDDTSMTIATCDSIKECGEINLKDIFNRFRDWLRYGEYTIDGLFDCGNTTSTAIRTGRGANDERSNGNGSLMRILPLAFTDADDETIRAVSALTHGHEISTAACVCYVEIARRLLKKEPLLDILATIQSPFERISSIYALAEDEIRSSGYVVDTLEAALWALSTTASYKDAVLKAVNLGSDTDTVGAVTGGLAGIMYGLEAIPKEWLERLRGKEIIENCLF